MDRVKLELIGYGGRYLQAPLMAAAHNLEAAAPISLERRTTGRLGADR